MGYREQGQNMSADSIVQRLNEWRAELLVNIADEPPFTDKLNGPVRNLPALEGDDLTNLKKEIEGLLADGWTPSLVERYMKFSEEVCPFWTEDYAIRTMKHIRDKAVIQGARR